MCASLGFYTVGIRNYFNFVTTLFYFYIRVDMKIFLLSSLILLSTLLISSCKKDNPIPPEDQPQVSLSLEDASCTEAWIKLTTANINLPTEVILKQDDNISQTLRLSSADTLLYVDSLLPNHTYKFQSVSQSISRVSNSIDVTTMDTTSHNFTFETFTFGGTAGSMPLYDVAIISENDIWAVGEIYLLDTLGQPDPNAYNVVHWDGSQWELKRVYFPTICGSTSQSSYPSNAIFAFDDGEIWISSSGNEIAILRDGIQVNKFCTPFSFSINKIWGTRSNDLYIVGNGGNIARHKNGIWSSIESGTELQFIDIYGKDDSKTGGKQILAVCTQNFPPGKGIFSLKGNIATEISSNIPAEQIAELFGIWFIPNRHYYIVGDGIYEKKILPDSIWRNGPLDITHYATTGIRGVGLNNIFVSGAFGEFLHFNGLSWKSYINELGSFSGSYGAIAVKNNMVITVGYQGRMAKILIGYRQ